MNFRKVASTIEWYDFPPFESAGFNTFVTGRGGGVSAHPFDSLNSAVSVGDEPKRVGENMRRICAAVDSEPLWLPNQSHSDTVIIVEGDRAPTSREGDALVVASPGVAIGVRTADCVPLLLADPVTRTAAAIHAGRVGTEKQITATVVALMVKRFGLDPATLLAAIAPCIRNCCYEVDQESAARFWNCCGGEGGRTVDMVSANHRQLLGAGVAAGNIIDSGVCTSCARDRFFSYRADNQVTGRFVTGIKIA